MRVTPHPEDLATGTPQPTCPRPEPRLTFEFYGALDDAPVDAAVALADTARLLLRHADSHAGRHARMRVAWLGSLHLWLTDPECSSACLRRSGHLPKVDGHDRPVTAPVRLSMGDDANGGLRLHWVLPPSWRPENAGRG